MRQCYFLVHLQSVVKWSKKKHSHLMCTLEFSLSNVFDRPLSLTKLIFCAMIVCTCVCHVFKRWATYMLTHFNPERLLKWSCVVSSPTCIVVAGLAFLAYNSSLSAGKTRCLSLFPSVRGIVFLPFSLFIPFCFPPSGHGSLSGAVVINIFMSTVNTSYSQK